jgi:hypothetical protein
MKIFWLLQEVIFGLFHGKKTILTAEENIFQNALISLNFPRTSEHSCLPFVTLKRNSKKHIALFENKNNLVRNW